MAMTPQMLAQLALKNPELLATMLAAKGIRPNQLQLAQAQPPPGSDQLNVGQPPVSPEVMARPAGTSITAPQGAQPMAVAPVGGPIPMPSPGQTFPGTMPQAAGAPAAGQPQLALGDILAGVKTPTAATQQRPGSAGQQQTANLNPNVLALMQWLAQNGAAGQGVASPAVTPSLGQLLGR